MRHTGNIMSDNETVFGTKRTATNVTEHMQEIIQVIKEYGYKLYQDRSNLGWYLSKELERPFTCLKVSLYNPTAKALLVRGLIKRVDRGTDRQTDFQYILKEI